MSKRKNIGLLINDIDGNYHTILWLMLKRAAEKFNCNLIVFEGRALGSSQGADKHHHIVYEFVDKSMIDGLIVTGGTLSNYVKKDEFERFIHRYNNIPLISLNETIPGYTGIILENKTGMRSLVSHLINHHHYKKIIFITGPEGNMDSDERYQAYLEILEENDIELNKDEYVYTGDFNSQTGYAIMGELIARNIPYDCIICSNDDMATGVIKYLKDLQSRTGINQDDKLVVCGFDDALISSFVKPALTTVKQPIEELCHLAFELMIKKINGEQIDEIIKLPTTLVIRESCRCNKSFTTEESSNTILRLLSSNRFHENVQTYSLDELFDCITTSLKNCRIKSCFISTYKDGTLKYNPNSIFDSSFSLPEYSKLIYGYNDFKRVEIDKSECYFETKHLVPDKFLPKDTRYNYLVNPLFFNNEHFGFVVFEVINDDVTIFDPLRGEISNTLKGTLMLIERAKMENSLIETEKLVSLGQLIGGISHNIMTPIMSLSGGLQALEDLTNEYKISIDNNDVTSHDHREIADEMLSKIDYMKSFMSYMSNLITTVKTQAIQLNTTSISKFILTELIDQINYIIATNISLKNSHFEINTKGNLDIEMIGDIGNLSLIIRSLLLNAAQSYDDIDFSYINKPIKIYVENDIEQIIIKVCDSGKGIPDSMKPRIFKTMFTTKGKNGAGLSLMLSYCTIRAKFGGEMWFESEVNKGSVFYISIPLKKEALNA